MQQIISVGDVLWIAPTYSKTIQSTNTSLAEEIQNAPMVIPLSMGVSTLMNGTLGFAMLLALVFCMPSDIGSLVESETYYPFMNIYAYAVGSNSGATAMVSPFNPFARHVDFLLLP